MRHCFSSALPLVPWGRRIPLETCFKIVVVFLAARSGFGAAISDAAARSSAALSSAALCNSGSAVEWLRQGSLAAA